MHAAFLLFLGCADDTTPEPTWPDVGQVPAMGEVAAAEAFEGIVPVELEDTGAGPVPPRGEPVACEEEIYVAQPGYVVDPLIPADAHAEIFGAVPAPYHPHLSWTGDPATTATLVWHTDADTLATQAELGVGLGYGAIVEGRSFLLDTNLANGRVHEVRVCGLEPGTSWHYRVGGTDAWSEDFLFTTAPPVGSTEPFVFGVIGDSRGDPTTWTQVLAGLESHGAEFRLFTGDAVSSGSSVTDWDSWFAGGAGYLEGAATMMAHGNHEGQALQYFALHAFPSNERWYSFDYGNAHFVALNDTVANFDEWRQQQEWLAADLAATSQPWKFVFHHQPAYSSSTVHAESFEVREKFVPYEEAGGVQMDFAGHNHFYERIAPLTQGVEDRANGIVYVITAGAGASLYPNDSRNWYSSVVNVTEHYTVVRIQDDILTLVAYDLAGNIIDTTVRQLR